jgi:hypothetical protein
VGSDDRWGTSFQEVDSGYRVDTVGVEDQRSRPTLEHDPNKAFGVRTKARSNHEHIKTGRMFEHLNRILRGRSATRAKPAGEQPGCGGRIYLLSVGPAYDGDGTGAGG